MQRKTYAEWQCQFMISKQLESLQIANGSIGSLEKKIEFLEAAKNMFYAYMNVLNECSDKIDARLARQAETYNVEIEKKLTEIYGPVTVEQASEEK